MSKTSSLPIPPKSVNLSRWKLDTEKTPERGRILRKGICYHPHLGKKKKMMKKTLIYNKRQRENFPMHRGKKEEVLVEGVTIGFQTKCPEAERGARAPARYLRGPGSAEPKDGLPGLQLASRRTEAPGPRRPRSRPKSPNAATPPHSGGPSPPRAGPRNRLRVTSPPPSPSTAAPAPTSAAAHPEPNAPLPRPLLGPRLTARGAPPAVAGGATLPQNTQTSSTRDRQLRAGCASRPSHGTSGHALASPLLASRRSAGRYRPSSHSGGGGAGPRSDVCSGCGPALSLKVLERRKTWQCLSGGPGFCPQVKQLLHPGATNPRTFLGAPATPEVEAA